MTPIATSRPNWQGRAMQTYLNIDFLVHQDFQKTKLMQNNAQKTPNDTVHVSDFYLS